MPYPPLIPAPVAASPNGSAKPDSTSAPPSANGASASSDPVKSKKRTKAKNGEEGGRASKKAKDVSQGDVQQQHALPNGGTDAAKEHPPPQAQQPPPPPYTNHVEPAAGPGPVPAFGGPEPRPLMAAM